MLPILLLPICVVLAVALYFNTDRRNGFGPFTAFRFASLRSLLLVSALAFAYTEIFSAFDSLNASTATTFWLICALFLIFFNYRVKSVSAQKIKAFCKKILLLKSLNSRYRILAGVLGVVVVLPLCFEAIYGTPNNLDSNNYHLLRIVSWMDNQNVKHFPTYHVQQLYHNVLSEYLIMQTMLLSGTDRFANLVQFVAMLGSLVAVSLMGKRFGFSYKSQILGAALLLFLPIGIFESTTTQNDYVACFFFLCFLVFGYATMAEGNRNGSILFMALSLAFGGFTKYPILLYAFPFCLYFGYRILAKFGFRYGSKTLAVMLVTLLMVFSPFFYRNFQLFGHVLAPPMGNRLHDESIPSLKHSPAYTLSTLSKNIGLHLGLPNDRYNKQVDQVITGFHRWLRIDLDDPATSNNPYYTRFVVHEEFMPNTFHFLLLLLVVPLVFWKSKNRELKILAVLGITGILLFSTLLKYQPFSTRTQMPLFAIGCILTAYALRNLLKIRTLYIILPFFLTSLFFIYGNPSKMLVPFRYYFKLGFGHLPRDVCPPLSDKAGKERFQSQLADYYDFSGKKECYPIRGWPDYMERIKILGKLDELGVTESDKTYGLLSTSRVQNYYMNHQRDYDQIMRLLPYLPRDGGNIGIIYMFETGYYHHLQTMMVALKKPITTRCVYYKSEYKELENAQQDFSYRYILSDSLSLAQRVIDPALIKDIIKTEEAVLVRLKENSSLKYLY